LLCVVPGCQLAQSQDRYKKWLDQDVGWIITAQDRADFLGLSSDEQFIVDFWEQRNPTPGSPQESIQDGALSTHRLLRRTLRQQNAGM
jgi:hypothetical protein